MDDTQETRGAARRMSFVDLSEVKERLLARFPRLPRLVEASARRRRLLRGLAAWRDEQKATQQMVAERIGSTQPAVARLELGKVDPRLSTLERYASALDANFIWQVVGDDGKPVCYDFTREADMEYRRNHPALGASTAGEHELAGSAEQHATSAVDLAREASSKSVVTVPGGAPQLMAEQITVSANNPTALKKVTVGSIISPGVLWDVPDLTLGAQEDEAAGVERVLLEV